MRQLQFGPADAGKQFILCYQALCFAKAPLARNELRAHGRLLTALEGIGVIANPNRGEADPPLYRCPDGGEVVVENEEHGILKRFLEAFVSDINRTLTRELDAALAWIESAPELPVAG